MISLEQRVLILERTVASYRRLICIGALVCCCAVLIGATQDSKATKITDVITTRSLEIVGNDEQTVAEITTNKDGAPTMLFFNPQGRIAVGIHGFGSGVIQINDARGRHLVCIGEDAGGGALFEMMSSESKRTVVLASGGGRDSGGSLRVLNKTGEIACTLAVDEYGNGRLGAWDRKGSGRTLQPGN